MSDYITYIVGFISSIGAISGIILYFLQRKVTGPSITANTTKTEKEVEQLEQEIEARYVLHVKKWLDDLQEVKDKHDREIEKKNEKLEEIHRQYLMAMKESAEHKLKLTQFHKATRRLLVNIDIPYWECGPEGRLVYANGQWLKLFGISSEAAMGEGWLASIPEDEKEKLLVEWYSKVVDEADGNIQFDVLNPITKERFHVKAFYVVVFDENQVVDRIIGVAMRL